MSIKTCEYCGSDKYDFHQAAWKCGAIRNCIKKHIYCLAMYERGIQDYPGDMEWWHNAMICIDAAISVTNYPPDGCISF